MTGQHNMLLLPCVCKYILDHNLKSRWWGGDAGAGGQLILNADKSHSRRTRGGDAENAGARQPAVTEGLHL